MECQKTNNLIHEERSMPELTQKPISICENFKEKHILITGATGFLGKVLLAKILHDLPSVSCVYVLIRGNKKTSAVDRFVQEILTSPAFQCLQEKHQENFNSFITKSVRVIEGEITQPDLGINQTVATNLFSKLNLVIHVAGLVDFFSDIRQALNINVTGSLNVAQFVSQCNHAKLLHISSCYVSGIRQGMIEENIRSDQAPNGLPFDAEQEWQTVLNIIENPRQPGKSKSIRRRYIEIGQERSSLWGWTNTYVYSKALAEILLKKRFPSLDITIVRPSIIESAIQFPLPGWNEGLTTTAPLCYLAKSWYPFSIGKKNIIIDTIPVDLVANAIIMIGAVQLLGQADPVYQLATSTINPCHLRLIKNSARNWFRFYLRQTAPNWTDKYLRTLVPVKFISPHHIFSPNNMVTFIEKMIRLFRNDKIKSILTKSCRGLQEIDKIYTIYLPFIYYNYFFKAEAIQKLVPIEALFAYHPQQIKWKDYLMNIHMPGLNQWIYQKLYESQPIPTQKINLTTEEKELLVLSY